MRNTRSNTRHVIPCLQRQKKKKIEDPTSCSFKKVSDDEVFTFKLL